MTTGDPVVDTLIRDTSSLWNTVAGDIVGTPATVTYSFMTRIPAYSSVTTFAAFTEDMKDAARAIFAQYEAVSRLHFVEVDGVAHRISRDEGGVHRRVSSRDREPVATVLCGFERGNARLDRCEYGVGPARSVAFVQQAHCLGFESSAQGLEILDLCNAESRYTRAAIRHELHESLCGEPRERGEGGREGGEQRATPHVALTSGGG